MDDLTSDTLGPRVVEADAERLERISRRASLYVALNGRDVDERRDLLAALSLPITRTTTPEDSHV